MTIPLWDDIYSPPMTEDDYADDDDWYYDYLKTKEETESEC